MPSLPDDVIQRTRDKYVEAFRAADRQRAAVAVRDQLDSLVQQMLDRGVRYEDARREFEKVFITRALQRSNGSVGDAAELLGIHRNTVTSKMAEYQASSVPAELEAASSQRRPEQVSSLSLRLLDNPRHAS